MKLSDYQLVVRIPIRAVDDAEARKIAHRIRNSESSAFTDDIDFKLQAVYPDKSPRGVSL